MAYLLANSHDACVVLPQAIDAAPFLIPAFQFRIYKTYFEF